MTSAPQAVTPPTPPTTRHHAHLNNTRAARISGSCSSDSCCCPSATALRPAGLSTAVAATPPPPAPPPTPAPRSLTGVGPSRLRSNCRNATVSGNWLSSCGLPACMYGQGRGPWGCVLVRDNNKWGLPAHRRIKSCLEMQPACMQLSVGLHDALSPLTLQQVPVLEWCGHSLFDTLVAHAAPVGVCAIHIPAGTSNTHT